LFLVDSAVRMAGICRLVEDMPPSGFIWVTDRAALLTGGAWSGIWARGGRLGMPLESILGRLVPNPSPAPASL